MDNFISWITENWRTVGEAVAGLLVVAGLITNLFDGPRKGKALSIFDRILGVLRNLGIGARYADEGPTKRILPFQGDTKTRVTATEDA